MLAEKDLRRAVKALPPAVQGDARTLGHANRRGIAVRRRTPDGSAVFGGKGEARRRTKGLVTHGETVRGRRLPLYLCGDRLYRGNAFAKLVMAGQDGREVAARAAPTDPVPVKRVRPIQEVTKRPRRDKAKPGAWLSHAVSAGAVLQDAMPTDTRVSALRLVLGGNVIEVPLTRHRGKQGRLLAQVSWAGSAGLANVTVVKGRPIPGPFIVLADPVAQVGRISPVSGS
ncbi:hypothetical protein [Methylobacterium sp.]|uniref:hypothetical protein n=1 Tax=Methylobacterium sp. TaxID=409 RepID=UPI003B029F3D